MKESRRVQMTKALLRQSLIELLEQESIGQISIKEICERANVSRSTFYSYYGSQYDLLGEIERGIIEETQELASGVLCHDEFHTKELLEHHLQYILDHAQALRIFSVGESEDYLLPKRALQIILLPYIDRCLAARKPPVSADEYEHICLFSIFGCIAIAKSWVLHPSSSTPRALAEEMLRYVDAVITSGSTKNAP